jgi:uncharacterized protein with von Willebrand factor type A (vWA) domain
MPARATLTSSLSAFGEFLRVEYHFSVGQEQARDALRALDVVGLTDLGRVRSMCRAVFCAKPEDIGPFERAFDSFFLTPRGLPQPRRSDRHTRPDPPGPAPGVAQPGQRQEGAPENEEPGGGGRRERRPSAENDAGGEPKFALRERYSAVSASAEAPEISPQGVEQMLLAARRLVARIRRGRSRRWAPAKNGTRFDARRTLRGSVRTAGDPLVLHRLGHPLRNPRFVILIDGSGSMAGAVGPMLEFARALNRSTRRCATFVFSTELRDVSREFRRPGFATLQKTNLEEAWGGGTRIGHCLQEFLHRDGARLLTPETFVLIFSDGLDVDEIGTLRRALREIRRRSAGIVWLNPHASSAGYAPSARGMQAALPFIDVFASAANEKELSALSDRF